MVKTQILHGDKIVESDFVELGNKKTAVWVDITDPQNEDWEAVATAVDARPRELSALLDRGQRPVVQDIGDFTVIAFHSTSVEEGHVTIRPHLLLASKEQKDFISVHKASSRSVERVNKYEEQRRAEIFKRGSTAILFALLNEMMNSANEVIDHISDEVEKVETEVFKPEASTAVLHKVFQLKKQLIIFQRSLIADREVISAIEKDYGKFLDKRMLSKFRLLYSDVTQLIETAITYRDIIISTVEIHLSTVSNNLNIVMKRLTAWASIILVPSLIAGIYGMNLAFLPYAKDPQGFWYVLIIMAISVGLLYSYFKRQDWI